MTERRLIISGTREALSDADRAIVTDLVLWYAQTAVAVGVGDCPTGVDALVRELFPDALVFTAAWGALGNRAGPERNRRMVAWAAERDGRDLAPAQVAGYLLAFPGPRSKGTTDCIRQARKAGLAILTSRVSR